MSALSKLLIALVGFLSKTYRKLWTWLKKKANKLLRWAKTKAKRAMKSLWKWTKGLPKQLKTYIKKAWKWARTPKKEPAPPLSDEFFDELFKKGSYAKPDSSPKARIGSMEAWEEKWRTVPDHKPTKKKKSKPKKK